jgi:radical SAM protein with 4Fe4S-binding SPASM domain
MKQEVLDAILALLRSYIKQGIKAFDLRFYAQGEPLIRLDLIQWLWDQAQIIKSESPDVEIKFFCGTNGSLINDSSIDQFVKIFDRAMISFDGLPEVQDIQRPTSTGAGSGEAVAKALELLLEKKFPFSIRATVTKQSTSQILGMISWLDALIDKYPQDHKVIFDPEPVCINEGYDIAMEPDLDEFYTYCFKAVEIAKNLELTQSNQIDEICKDRKNRLFACGVFTSPGVFIQPNGDISACSRTPLTGKFANIFTYGSYDSDQKAFIVDYDKLTKVKELGLLANSLPECLECEHLKVCNNTCVIDKFMSPSFMNCKITKKLAVLAAERQASKEVSTETDTTA